jgi:hypothetical protein
MSFDALTITGILAALLSGGFLIALVRGNDAGSKARPALAKPILKSETAADRRS